MEAVTPLCSELKFFRVPESDIGICSTWGSAPPLLYQPLLIYGFELFAYAGVTKDDSTQANLSISSFIEKAAKGRWT